MGEGVIVLSRRLDDRRRRRRNEAWRRLRPLRGSPISASSASGGEARRAAAREAQATGTSCGGSWRSAPCVRPPRSRCREPDSGCCTRGIRGSSGTLRHRRVVPVKATHARFMLARPPRLCASACVLVRQGWRRTDGEHRPVRECRPALRHRGTETLSDVCFTLRTGRLLFPHRRERRGQDLAAQAALPRAAADARHDPAVRRGRGDAAARPPARLPPADRRGVPGFPAGPAPVGVRQRRAAAARRGRARERDRRSRCARCSPGSASPTAPRRGRRRCRAASSSASRSRAR